MAGRDGKDTKGWEGDTTRPGVSILLTSQELNGNINRPTTIMEQLRIHVIMIYSYQFGHFAISLYCYDACTLFVIISL